MIISSSHISDSYTVGFQVRLAELHVFFACGFRVLSLSREYAHVPKLPAG